jgi:pyruvate-formate lyase-activating enzyme
VWFEQRYLYVTEYSKYKPLYKGSKYIDRKIVDKENQITFSQYRNYYGYPGFLSGGIRMCEKVNKRVAEEIERKKNFGQLMQTFDLEEISL